MIKREEKSDGLLIYDDGKPVRNLNSEELQKMIDYYADLISTIKEKNNCIPEAKYTHSGIGTIGPRVAAGFFYDGSIKYGTYCYPNEKTTHRVTEEELQKINSRLKQAEAKLRKKQYIKESLEKLNPFSKGRKK